MPWILIEQSIDKVDNIKCNTQQAELKQLEFHATWDRGIFYRQILDKVEWFYLYRSIYLSRLLEFRNKGRITERYILYV